MPGDDCVRRCSACRLNVYNLSGMTRGEAAELLHRTEGRLCVRFYRRKDGTVLTSDCPVGKRLKLSLARIGILFLVISQPLWALLVGIQWREIQAPFRRWAAEIEEIQPVMVGMSVPQVYDLPPTEPDSHPSDSED